MFEVKKRSATSRIAEWSGDDWKIRTPAILYPSTARIVAPDFADALLGEDDNGNHIRIRDSTLPIPNYFGVPAGFVSDDCRLSEMKVESSIALVRPGIESQDLSGAHGHLDLVVMENSIELFQNPRMFIETLVRVRKIIGYQKGLYLPGVALPNNLAVLVYSGADVLDAVRVLYLTRKGFFMTSDGIWPSSDVDFDTCVCAGCQGSDPEYERLLNHNLLVFHNELQQVRNRLLKGNFREFVEYRAKTSPELVSMIRTLDSNYYEFQEKRFPVIGPEFHATTRLSLNRPDVVRFRERVLSRYWKPEDPDVLLLLPCSARKPYSQSKSHRKFKEAIRNSGISSRVHEIIITSPLGLVPRELELMYPARHYDIPVTGYWYDEERKMINTLLENYLAVNKYEHIFVHLDDEGLFDDIGGAIYTARGRPTSAPSLKSLQDALSKLAGSAEKPAWKKRSIDEMNNMARFQWGEKAQGMFDRCGVKGRYPFLKIFRIKDQLAMISETSGQLIPTIQLGKELAERGIYCVLMYDFELTGNLFAVGVESADPYIRVGDEVCVISQEGLTATGTAKMNAEEMVESGKGEAVRVRHKVR